MQIRRPLRHATALTLSFATRSPARLRASVGRIGQFGFGRQSALVVARRIVPVTAHGTANRAMSLMVGSLLIGAAVAMLTQARLGLSPYDVFVSGLLPHVGLTFGQTVWLVSACFFAIAALLGQFPSRWGIAYVLANGVAIDAVAHLINEPHTLVGRFSFVVGAVVLVSAGIALVVHSGSTGGSFELLMRAGEVRGFDRRKVRTTLEVSILLAGVVLGGSIGPATLIMAAAIGPTLGAASQALDDWSLGRSVRRTSATPAGAPAHT